MVHLWFLSVTFQSFHFKDIIESLKTLHNILAMIGVVFGVSENNRHY